MVGFVDTLGERIKQDEEELKQLEDEKAAATKKAEEDEKEAAGNPELNEEEKTFKQRYGQLRTYQQEQKKQLDGQIQKLNDTVNSLKGQVKSKVELPKTTDEIKVFAAENPDSFAVIKTMVLSELNETKKEYDGKFEELSKREQLNELERLKNNIRREHPDFDSISEEDEFHAWIKTKPPYVARILYDEPEDWQSASDIVSMYKSETKKKTSKKKDSRSDAADAARSVDTSSSPSLSDDSSGYDFSESQIQKMSGDEYEKLEEDIDKARVAGRIKLDLSGGAR